LLLCALIRAGWIGFPGDPIAPVDAEGFHLLAVNVLADRGFAIGWSPPFCPTGVRTPLYPAFLLMTYLGLGVDPVRAVRVQILLDVLTTALVIVLGREMVLGASGGGSRSVARRVGFWAGMGYALNGTATRYTGVLLSESLLLPLLAWALWMTVRYLSHPTGTRAGMIGLSWGLAVLTKPNVQYLALAVVVLMATRALSGGAGRWRQIVLAVGVLAAVVLPWGLRNHRVFGRWMLSTAFEENLARVSAVATLAEMEGIRAEPWSETWEHIYARFAEQVTGQAPSEAELLSCEARVAWHRQLANAARSLVWSNLGSYVRVHLQGAMHPLIDPGHRVWYRLIAGSAWSETGVVPDIWTRIGWSLDRGAVGDAIEAFISERISNIPPVAALIWWGLFGIRIGLAGLSFRGIWHLRFERWLMLLFAGSIGYLLLLPGPIAHDRFLLPTLPVVLPLAASGLLRLSKDPQNTDV
jgi:hypothetical protein